PTPLSLSFPYPTLFRSVLNHSPLTLPSLFLACGCATQRHVKLTQERNQHGSDRETEGEGDNQEGNEGIGRFRGAGFGDQDAGDRDRKSTRLNSSHGSIS